MRLISILLERGLRLTETFRLVNFGIACKIADLQWQQPHYLKHLLFCENTIGLLLEEKLIGCRIIDLAFFKINIPSSSFSRSNLVRTAASQAIEPEY